MFSSLRTRRRNREIVEALYAILASEARNPRLYDEGGIPDTAMGRFEALSIQVYLFLRRCRQSDSLAPLAQDVVDRFIYDVEVSIRELGVGDQGVPKRMRRLAGRFYERVAAYDEVIEKAEPALLREALATRAVAPEAAPAAADKLADMVRSQADSFAAWSTAAILSGTREKA